MKKRAEELKIIVRGGGDIGSGVAWRLNVCGFKVLITEIEKPLCVRRKVSFSEAVYAGMASVQGAEGVLISDVEEIEKIWEKNQIPVIIDPECEVKNRIPCHVLIDCIMAKKNLGTNINDAPLVIGVGPGFTVGEDVHFVVETKRGHNLGRLLTEGSAAPDSGIPGAVMGITEDRVLRAPASGIWHSQKDIGDYVKAGELIGHVMEHQVRSKIDGILRGVIKSGIEVTKGLKIGDIDPRGVKEYCYTISDKALSIAGGVLEGLLRKYRGQIFFINILGD